MNRDHATLHVDCPNCGQTAAFAVTSLVQARTRPPMMRDQPVKPACGAPKIRARAKPNTGTVCVYDLDHDGEHSWEKPR